MRTLLIIIAVSTIYCALARFLFLIRSNKLYRPILTTRFAMLGINAKPSLYKMEIEKDILIPGRVRETFKMLLNALDFGTDFDAFHPWRYLFATFVLARPTQLRLICNTYREASCTYKETKHEVALYVKHLVRGVIDVHILDILFTTCFWPVALLILKYYRTKPSNGDVRKLAIYDTFANVEENFELYEKICFGKIEEIENVKIRYTE